MTSLWMGRGTGRGDRPVLLAVSLRATLFSNF